MRCIASCLCLCLSLAPACSKQEPAPGATAEAAGRALSVGQPAPDVELPLHDGSRVKLRDLAGAQVLVYFYPKDDTPGCTTEAKGLRDRFDDLTKAGVKVYGVSMDDAASHEAFIDKHELPYPLVVDGDGTIADAFAVPHTMGFAKRHSFLIGADGKLKKIWREVDPAGHAAEVLAAAGAS